MNNNLPYRRLAVDDEVIAIGKPGQSVWSVDFQNASLVNLAANGMVEHFEERVVGLVGSQDHTGGRLRPFLTYNSMY